MNGARSRDKKGPTPERSGHKRNRCYPLSKEKVKLLRDGEDVWASVPDPLNGVPLRVLFTGDPDADFDQGSLVYIQHTNYQGPAVIGKDGWYHLGDGRGLQVEGSFIESIIGVAKIQHPRRNQGKSEEGCTNDT